MPRILISYRREDSDAITGRIFDRLIAHYGRGVSCELVSENAKFPASSENTGNFIDSGLGGASGGSKKGMKSVSYGPIPYAS
jgi:hypothetical protein